MAGWLLSCLEASMIPLDELKMWLEAEREREAEGTARYFALTYALLDLPRLKTSHELVHVLRARVRNIPDEGRRKVIEAKAEEIIGFIESTYTWNIWEYRGGFVRLVEGPFDEAEQARVRSL